MYLEMIHWLYLILWKEVLFINILIANLKTKAPINIYNILIDIRNYILNITKSSNDLQDDNILYIDTMYKNVSKREKTEYALKKYGDSILRIGCSYLKSVTDAEDILQETLIKHLQYTQSFYSDEHEKAWLIRVAINLCKNRLKKQKIRNHLELDENLIAIENEDLKFIWEAVSDLPVKYREVIHLYYHEGYTTAQISKILDKKDVTVRSLLHRARKELKVILKDVYDFEE